MIQLDDETMKRYLADGYLTLQTNFPVEFHRGIWEQAERIFEAEGNPGNDIYPRVKELGEVLDHPGVRGALTGILGPDYFLHPHRHCHQTPPGKDAQSNHKDSYEDDENVRHHRSRWAMVFYYPQDVDAAIGPTAVTPGSQYFTESASLDALEEVKLCGPAGTVTVVHYDVWHRATANQTDQNRYMMKFLFCRKAEPTSPAWNLVSSSGSSFSRNPAICRHLWDWNRGDNQGGPAAIDPEKAARLEAELTKGPEPQRIDASYALGEAGEVDRLLESLRRETVLKLAENLERSHTNAAQVDAVYGLTVAGAAAIPALTELLQDSEWPTRAACADILGNIGRPAASAVPALTESLADESEWVRRNAAEALGTLNAAKAVPDLTGSLSDESDRVRHNALLSLLKIGRPAAPAEPAIRRALEDENRYVRALSRQTLRAIDN